MVFSMHVFFFLIKNPGAGKMAEWLQATEPELDPHYPRKVGGDGAHM